MTTLHTFGCSISQGFALPDTVKPALDSTGRLLTNEEVIDRGIHWSEIHLYQPSDYAWPAVLGRQLGIPVVNHARRGACFQQIARQCAVAFPTIKPQDTVIVMWTFLSRISLQWPARTAVPFSSMVNANWGWKTVIAGFNKFFGLSDLKNTDSKENQQIQQYIHDTVVQQLDPMGVYNRYYNNLVLQTVTDGLLRSTGARVIHLSVELEPVLEQLQQAQRELTASLREPYWIPDPETWYQLQVDYDSCYVIHDPDIPPAENDTHPSVLHHSNFAQHLYQQYFQNTV
jgi:hypothetical protein